MESCQRELAADTDGGEDKSDRAQAAWMRRYTCGAVATELARRGTASDRERLWQTFDQPETAEEMRVGIVGGMLAARLQEAAAELEPVAAAIPSAARDPLLGPIPARSARLAEYFDQPAEPAWFEEAPPELRESWRRVSSARSAYGRAGLTLAGEEPTSFMVDAAGFFEAVADYLRGRLPAAEALERIGRFEWGSWCGTGADAFLEPRDQALLLVLLDLGRTDLAAGALLAVADGERQSLAALIPDAARSDPGWPRLAERLGFEWEGLAIGSLLDGRRAAATTVARLGSERGARLLLRAMELRAPDSDSGERLGDDDTSMAAIATLVTPGEGCDGFATGSLDQVREASELPTDVQLDALAALAARASDASGLDLAAEAARQLHRLCRGESLTAFESMSRSRFSVIREHAAQARRALAGDDVRSVAAPPVELRVMVGGAAWRGPVVTTVGRTGRMTTETVQTDEQGRLRLDRDQFVDPKAPVRSVHVKARDLDGAADVWFVGEARAPRDLGAMSPITVELQAVTIVLPDRHAGPCADGACRVRLEAELPFLMLDDEAGGEFGSPYLYFQRIAHDRPLQVERPWTVRLARGVRYHAVVEDARGSWTSPVVVPRTKPLTLTLRGDRLQSSEDEMRSLMESVGR